MKISSLFLISAILLVCAAAISFEMSSTEEARGTEFADLVAETWIMRGATLFAVLSLLSFFLEKAVAKIRAARKTKLSYDSRCVAPNWPGERHSGTLPKIKK